MSSDEIIPPERRGSEADTSELMRQVRIHTERAVKKDETSLPVRLRGGPMDGYLVHDDAPALRDDWHTTWPTSVAEKRQPGHYVLLNEMEKDARVAEWRPFPGERE